MPWTFTPPTVLEAAPGQRHRLFGRLRLDRGVSVLKFEDSYRQVREPSAEDVEAADAVYLGGHVHEVDDAEAAALTAAGYGAYLTGENG